MLLVSIVKVLQSQLQLILKEPSLMFKIHNLKDILFGKIFEGFLQDEPSMNYY